MQERGLPGAGVTDHHPSMDKPGKLAVGELQDLRQGHGRSARERHRPLRASACGKARRAVGAELPRGSSGS